MPVSAFSHFTLPKLSTVVRIKCEIGRIHAGVMLKSTNLMLFLEFGKNCIDFRIR